MATSYPIPSVICTDPDRRKLAIAYILSVADLQRAVNSVVDNQRNLNDTQKRLLNGAAVVLLERQIEEMLALLHHYLTPIKVG